MSTLAEASMHNVESLPTSGDKKSLMPVTHDIRVLLEKVLKWDYNIFELEILTDYK